MLSKILAPIDFSERSWGSARYAGLLASRFQCELTLLHVMDDSGRSRADADFLMAGFLPDEFRGVTVDRKVIRGNPSGEIVNYARSEGTSLIVANTHGHSPFRPFLLGSVVAGVLNEAECPVLTCRHLPNAFPEQIGNFRKIVCAVDLCPHSGGTLDWAARFAAEFDAELTIVHVTPSTAGGFGDWVDPDHHSRMATEAREHDFFMEAQQRIRAMQSSAGTNAGVVIDSGIDVPGAVCAVAADLSADLVVVGRGRSEGVERRRTKVCSIVRQSPCPVVSV